MESEDQKNAPTPPKPIPRRRKKKLIIAFGVVAVALIIIFWGWSSTGAKSYLQVGTLVDSSAGGTLAPYMNKSLEVQGVITGWDGGPGDLHFELADQASPVKTIEVNLSGALPAEFANGKTAVVKGQIEGTSPLELVGTGVTLGCASRY